MSICFYDGYGCYHPEGSTDECVTSALRFSDAEYDGETISAIEDEQVGFGHVVQVLSGAFRALSGKSFSSSNSVRGRTHCTTSKCSLARTSTSHSSTPLGETYFTLVNIYIYIYIYDTSLPLCSDRTIQYSNCVGFDLSQFEVPEGEREGQQENVLIVVSTPRAGGRKQIHCECCLKFAQIVSAPAFA